MLEDEEFNWPMSNVELAKLLGISRHTIRNHQRNHKDELIEGEDYRKEDIGVPYAPGPMTVWLEKGAIKVAQHCRTQKASNFLEKVGAARRHISGVESRFIDIIVASFEGLTRLVRQYPAGPYQIDLFLPDLKIAIECDERGHEGIPSWKEEGRQEFIEELLKCQFIRFNPNDLDFNIGTVINGIIRILLGNNTLKNV